MVLEPLSALAIASSVVQFVDFGAKLVTKTHAIHKGVNLDNRELLIVSERLQQLSSGLTVSIDNFDRSNVRPDSTVPDNAETALHDVYEVARGCQKIASEFEEDLSQLQPTPGQSAWKSFRQAFKSLRGKRELEQRASRLTAQRDLLTTHMIAWMVHTMRQEPALPTKVKKLPELERRLFEMLTDGNGKRLCADLATTQRAAKEQETTSWDQTAVRERYKQTWRADHRDDITDLSVEFTDTLNTSQRLAAQDRILRSLHFARIDDRRKAIQHHHSETFRWVFDPNKPDQLGFSNFAQWLKAKNSDNNLYWVGGKPGSGKSTLMRFLTDTPRTGALLEKWSGNLPLIRCSAFFWLGGSDLQKSLQGLFRTLLFNILSSHQEHIPEVAQWRWRASILNEDSRLPEWTTAELSDALYLLVDLVTSKARLFILIDGLDEYAGSNTAGDEKQRDLETFEELTALVQLLKSLSAKPGVKLCVSSRHWAVFMTGFKKCPSLRLENLTAPDIENYVDAKLRDATDSESVEDEYDSIKAEIVRKADGVFLWVYLAVRNITRGIVEGDSTSQLLRQLQSLPSDLEEFFQRIIEQIPSDHRPRATLYLRVMLKSRDRPTLLDMFFLEEDEATQVDATALTPLSVKIVAARKNSMKKRLESRCKGLIEARDFLHGSLAQGAIPTEGMWVDSYVDYLHRTVRDFLMGRAAQELLDEYSSADFDVQRFLCRSVIAQMRIIESTDRDLAALASTFLRYAHEHETRSGLAQNDLLEDFFKLLNHHVSKLMKVSSVHSDKEAKVGVALFMQLEKYALQQITKAGFRASAQCSHPFLSVFSSFHKEISLLGCCLLPRETVFDRVGTFENEFLHDFVQARRNRDQPEDPEQPMNTVIEALLQRGANPNEPFRGKTLWEHFLGRVYAFQYTTPERLSPWATAARHLIRYGAKNTGQDPRYAPQIGVKAVAGHRMKYIDDPRDLRHAVRYIFAECGGDDLASQMHGPKTRLTTFFNRSRS